ncbi:MAG: glycosyltransferase [Lachnospiraceae bacterium]|nr:glycosyltransferase [Lachnospiraceae bacterium]
MKVLFITNIPSPYRVAFFNEWGKRCDLTVLFEKSNSDERDEKWQSDIFRYFNGIILPGVRVRVDQALAMGVVKFLKNNKFDWIIVSDISSPTGLLAISYLKRKRIPFSIEGDGAFVPNKESWIKKKIKSYAISAATSWLCTCDEHEKYVLHYGAKKEGIYRYPFSSVREEEILKNPLTKEQKEEKKRQLGVTERKMILYVGQFIHRKGVDVLVEASKMLGDDIGIYLVGGSVQELSNLVSEWRSTVHVIDFLTQEELKEYYQAADVFVLPTREDIWGLVVNEAMANGLPVITTDCCNAGKEMIAQNAAGRIVPISDAEKLKDAINIMLYQENVDSVSKFSLKCANMYTVEKMVQSHMEIGEQLKLNILFCGSFIPNNLEYAEKYCSAAGNRFQNNFIKNLKNLNYCVREVSYIGFPISLSTKEELIKIHSEKVKYHIKEKNVFSTLAHFRKSIISRMKGCSKVISYNVVYAWLGLPRWCIRNGVKSYLILADYSDITCYHGIVKKIYAYLQLKSIQRYDVVIGLSNRTRRFLRQNQEFIVMHGGIDKAFYDYFEELSIKNVEKIKIMYSGLLNNVTGVDLLLEAFHNIATSNVELHITGKGQYQELVEDNCRQDDRIIYDGFLEYEEYMNLLKDADILVNPRNMNLPENQNNFPSKILDYLAAGKIIVSTSFPGSEEFKDAIIFVESNEDAICKGIEEAIIRLKNRDVYFDICRKKAKEYLWEEQINKILA